MSLSSLYDVALGLLALVGVAAIATVLMPAWPVRPPPPPASIHSGAREIDETGAPDLSRHQARDGTWLAGYVWSGAAFPLWLAAVSGGGYILCGLWMRRA
ncbi:MAG TPA: hypothetical protein VIJ63_24840 [Roseiarcus sp.]